MRFIYDRNKTAVIYKDREYSFKEIITDLKYYSSLLDIEDGDRVVIAMENRPEMIMSIYGTWDTRGISTILDPTYTPEQYAYAFNDCKPKYIFTSNKSLENIKKGVELTDLDIKIFVVDDISVPDFTPNNYEVEIDDPERVAIILYTSGTTGNPKGVMLTFNNLESNMKAIREIELVNERDRVLAILPFYHIFPLNLTLFMPMYFGTFLVILDELSSSALTHALKTYQISVMIGVPRVWELLHKSIMTKINASGVGRRLFSICKKIDSFPLNKIIFKKVGEGLGGHMRVLASGGAKINPDILKDYRTFGIKIIEGYGLTETSPLVAFNRLDNIVIGSVGELIPDIDVKLGEDDEILIRGANVMKGYYNNPTATSEAIDKDGFFHTGDLGKLEGRRLFIVGRKKEMIVLSNGKNINPADIEAEILNTTNLITEMAVMEYNNHLMAIVYPDFDAIRRKNITNIKETLKWEIIDKYNINAPKYRKILEIKIVGQELPKTKVGKIRRFMLPNFLKNLDGDKGETRKKIEVPKDIKPIYEVIKNYLQDNIDMTNIDSIEPNYHLELDLGMDSLDIVEFLAYLENSFNIKISEQDFSECKNILDIASYIHKNGGNYHNIGGMDWEKILNEKVDVKLPVSNFYVKLFKFLLKPFFWFYVRITKINLRNIPETQAIYVGNHQSYLDVLIFNDSVKNKKLNNTYYIAIATHFDSDARRYLARHGNVILIDINKNLKDTIQIAGKVLKEGKNLVIFPEGARTRDGHIQEFKKTFAILSKVLNIPVVPFAIKGAYKIMPYGSSFPRPGRVEIKFFPEIKPKDITIEQIVAISHKEIMDCVE